MFFLFFFKKKTYETYGKVIGIMSVLILAFTSSTVYFILLFSDSAILIRLFQKYSYLLMIPVILNIAFSINYLDDLNNAYKLKTKENVIALSIIICTIIYFIASLFHYYRYVT